MEERNGIDRESLNHLCEEFHKSTQFKKLAKKTQEDYEYSRNVLVAIPTKLQKPLGDLSVRKFTSALVQRLVDRIADEGTPSKAAHVLRYLRRVMQWGRNRGYLEINVALGIEAPAERKQRRLPSPNIMAALIARAHEKGQLTRGQRGSCPAYLGYVMELAYLCRLRGIEAVTLSDANELEEGVQTNRRKGSRDNVVRWTAKLRSAWDGAKAYRQRVWTTQAFPVPVAADRRFIIVAAHGGALQKSSLDTTWQRFITKAIKDGVLTDDQRFALHDLKRRGITDTPGDRKQKQDASGHRDESMLDIYDFSLPLVHPSGD
jgi:site-specific recombinase XerC